MEHFEPRKDPRVVEVSEHSPQHEAVLDAIEQKLSDCFGHDARARYSAYECDSDGVPINNLGEIAVRGTVVIIGKSDEFFGGAKSLSYQSSPITNPTWLDLCGILNEQLACTKDFHHVFLEGLLDANRTIEVAGKRIHVFELELGS